MVRHDEGAIGIDLYAHLGIVKCKVIVHLEQWQKTEGPQGWADG